MTTSQRYRDEINREGIRGRIETTITTYVESILFNAMAVVSSNGQVWFSDVTKTKYKKKPPFQFSTLEHNLLVLDGTRIYPKETTNYFGFISNEISGEDCVYAVPPTITVVSDTNKYKFINLTLEFDNWHKDCPADFDVKYYFNDTLVKTVEIRNNTTYHNMVVEGAEDVNKIEIIFLKSKIKHHRVRMENIVFGLVEIHTPEQIISFEQFVSISPLSKEINSDKFSFKIENINDEYDPENPLSKSRYFEVNQISTVSHSLFFEDDTFETIDGGIWYMNGKPKVEEDTITFELTKKYQKLTEVYKYGVWKNTPTSFYELFDTLFKYAFKTNIEGSYSCDWEIDQSLNDISTYQPLPDMEINKILALLLNASNTILLEDVGGTIHIKPNNAIVSDYEIPLTTVYKYPTYLEPLTNVKNCIVKQNSLTEMYDKELLSKKDNLHGTKTYTEKIPLATEHSYTITGGTVTNIQYYAYYAIFTVQAEGNFQLTITGKEVESSESLVTYNENIEGEDVTFENIFLTTYQLVDRYAQFMIKYLKDKLRYNISWRGDGALYPQDIILLDTKYANNLPSMILDNKIKMSGGAWSSEMNLKNITIE